MKSIILFGLAVLAPAFANAAEIKRIWLTHRSHDPSRIVISWTTDQPADSVVYLGKKPGEGETIRKDEHTTLHHVEVPLDRSDADVYYRVGSGQEQSATYKFKAYPTDVLRVAIVADWQSKPDLTAIENDNVHLLLTAGDNITNLWQTCGEGIKDCVTPYAELIDTYPDLFRSTPFMPALGNHDREIRPRGAKPPSVPVYDVEASAFRHFFELPDDEWKWHFHIPEFELRFVALDFNHISDFGTTWQTCHALDAKSEQFLWYEKLTQERWPFTVTLYNERNANIRNQASAAWHDLFRRGTCAITGFGYFAERAQVDGFDYYNTSLSGTGDQYPDPHSQFLAAKDSYILVTTERTGNMTVAIKSLNGQVLDQRVYRRQR